jgi:hypothetical protein
MSSSGADDEELAHNRPSRRVRFVTRLRLPGVNNSLSGTVLGEELLCFRSQPRQHGRSNVLRTRERCRDGALLRSEVDNDNDTARWIDEPILADSIASIPFELDRAIPNRRPG